MCPHCGSWLINADSHTKKAQAERGLHTAQCNRCGRFVVYDNTPHKPPAPTEPKQLIFVFED